MEYIDRLLLGTPGERTFYRVKVPKLPGGRKVYPKSRVSIVRRNLKKARFWELQGFPMGKSLA